MTAIISYSYFLYEPRSIMVVLEKGPHTVLYDGATLSSWQKTPSTVYESPFKDCRSASSLRWMNCISDLYCVPFRVCSEPSPFRCPQCPLDFHLVDTLLASSSSLHVGTSTQLQGPLVLLIRAPPFPWMLHFHIGTLSL